MADVLEYKCPNCGAPITFDSTTQKMKCGSCGTEMEMEAFQAYDAVLKQGETQTETVWHSTENNDWQEGENSISASICQSCGGELIMDGTTVATECPYCGNAAIIPEQVSDILRPEIIIPFELDKEAAKNALKQFYKGKVLLPKFFKEDNRVDKITGMYVPFWLYDCDTSSNAVFDATRTHHWRSGDMEYTKTEHYLITRSGDMRFEKIPADGSEKMDDTMMEAIEPFNYDGLKPFSMAYLSGYLADKYDVDAEANKPRIDRRIHNSVNRALRDTVRGYATVGTRSLNVNMQNGQVYYALFPVWILNTKWDKKIYSFAMNGQTGKFVGDLPIDWKKAGLIGGGVFLAAAIVLLIGGYIADPTYDTLNNLQIAAIIAILVSGLSFITYLPVFKKTKEKGKESDSKSKN